MIRSDREVKDPVLIDAMLAQFSTMVLSLDGEDGHPYSVPMNFGYEMDDKNLRVYVHFTKRGKKVDLMHRDPRCTLQFHSFLDFPDSPYKRHRHDYRRMTAKGSMEILDPANRLEEFRLAHEVLMHCNAREMEPRHTSSVPNMYMGRIVCPLHQVRAKSEFPLNKPEDVPYRNLCQPAAAIVSSRENE